MFSNSTFTILQHLQSTSAYLINKVHFTLHNIFEAVRKSTNTGKASEVRKNDIIAAFSSFVGVKLMKTCYLKPASTDDKCSFFRIILLMRDLHLTTCRVARKSMNFEIILK